MVNKILAVVLASMLVGCIGTPKEPVPVPATNEIVHPSMPTAPANPGVEILVITTDTIKPNTAYVGFEYDEWLNFAKWMHSYKAYNDDLLEVIRLYKEQDPALQKKDEKIKEKGCFGSPFCVL
ncbi:hypothetical protein VPFG_00135 [Vibrio phage nt-1]|uniref:Uncharacterized protein n=1 Tax=Vibrio phage nt-1 TaxID=115992 RepID=R9TJ69_9CAUD|nr:Rz-like spanin [Vibrio phage nt-1]AGN30137.1 hypothetical protein VPFG_00135 [Vibrio phage nt-1]